MRIGISGGETLSLTRFDNTKAPWGRDMILSKRIMDMSNPGQILVSEGTTEQAAQFNKEYKFKHMGEHIVKHEEKVKVYSFSFEDEYGNKIGNDETILCECHSLSKNDSKLAEDKVKKDVVKEGTDLGIIKFKESKDLRFRILYMLFYEENIRGSDANVLNDLEFVDQRMLRSESRSLIRGQYVSVDNGRMILENKGTNEINRIIEGFANYLLSQEDRNCKADAKQIEITGGHLSPEFHRIKNLWKGLFIKFLNDYEGLE